MRVILDPIPGRGLTLLSPVYQYYTNNNFTSGIVANQTEPTCSLQLIAADYRGIFMTFHCADNITKGF